MNPRALYSALFAATLPAYTLAQQPVTPRNWRSHPDIRQIRRLATATDSELALGKLRAQKDSAECNGGAERVTAYLYTDSTGHVREYVIAGGSDDSAGEVRYYYDGSGRLRFTFERLGAVNGTERETRVYFDSTGTQLYKDVRLIKGPGYPGGFELVVADPAAEFRSLCGPSH